MQHVHGKWNERQKYIGEVDGGAEIGVAEMGIGQRKGQVAHPVPSPFPRTPVSLGLTNEQSSFS